jgi:hypothetical protein
MFSSRRLLWLLLLQIPKAALHDKPSSPNLGPGVYKTPTDTLGLQVNCSSSSSGSGVKIRQQHF